jgi:hypothetical protein
VRAAGKPYSEYVARKIGDPPAPADVLRDRYGAHAEVFEGYDEQKKKDIEAYDKRYDEFYRALVETYTLTAYEIRVPFFGFRFDVNDLAFIGALAFIVILIMYRFSLAREIANVKAGFDKAIEVKHVPEFYELLSLHQVLTVPRSIHVRRTWFSKAAPKVIWTLPLILQSIVVGHDLFTLDIGFSMDALRTKIVLAGGPLLIVLVILATVPVIRLAYQLDDIWDSHYDAMNPSASASAGSAANVVPPQQHLPGPMLPATP